MKRWLRSPEGLIGIGFAALVLAYVSVMVFTKHGPPGPRVAFGPDSQIYMDAAYHPVWTRDFLAARGPFLYLLLAKVSARNLQAIALVQSIIYVGGWLFLATTARSIVRTRWVQLGLYTALLLVALAPSNIQWNLVIATESLSVALTCIVIGTALRLALVPSSRRVAWFVVSLVPFVFVRDTNALTALVLAGLAVLLVIFRAQWRRIGAVVAVSAVAMAGVALLLSSRAEPPRWYYPLTETIALRLVGDGDAEPYFVERGLPLDEHLVALGDTYFVTIQRFDDDPGFAPLREWIRDEGQGVYTRFLVTHPWWTLREPVADWRRLLSPDLTTYGLVSKIEPIPAYRVSAIAYPGSAPLVAAWSVVAVIGLGVVAWIRRASASSTAVVTVVAVTGLLAVAGFYAAWHGDALEVDRHSLTAATQLRIALWLATALVMDALVKLPYQTDLQYEQQHGEPADDERPEPVGG